MEIEQKAESSIMQELSRRDGGMEKSMVKSKVETKIRQTDSYEIIRGADTLVINENDGTHYNGVNEGQIIVPIGDVDEYLHNLKGDE